MPWNTFNRSDGASSNGGRQVSFFCRRCRRGRMRLRYAFFYPPFPTQKELTIPWGNRLTTCMYFHTVIKNELNGGYLMTFERRRRSFLPSLQSAARQQAGGAKEGRAALLCFHVCHVCAHVPYSRGGVFWSTNPNIETLPKTMWWQFFEFHHHRLVFFLSPLCLSLSLALFQRRLKVESTGVGITCELSSRLSEALLW